MAIIKGAGELYERDIYKNLIESGREEIKILNTINKLLKEQAKLNRKFIDIDPKTIADLKKVEEGVKKTEQAFKNKLKTDEAIQKNRLAELKLQKDRENAFDKFERTQQKAIKTTEKQRLSELKLASDRKKAFDRADRRAKQEQKIRATAIKNAQKLRKTTIDNANAFKILQKQTNTAQARFKRLAAEFGITSVRAEKARKTFERLDSRLRKINKTARDGRRDVGRYGLAFQGLRGTIGKGLGLLGITAGVAALGLAIRNTVGIFTKFEKANSNLEAVLSATFETAEDGREQMELLSLEARRLGASTAFTATQVVEMETALAKLGFPTDAILQMTESTLAAAAAMGSGLGETAELTGSILKSFRLDANQAARVNDVLAKSTSISALDFQKLSSSMSTIAPVAKAANFSLEGTVSLLGSLSDAGFDASSAATATRKILLNLADSNGKLAKSLKEPVKDLPSLVRGLKQLRDEGTDLGRALELTDVKSVAAFKTFLEGTDDILEMNDALETAAGTAQRMADIQLDNLSGAVTKLTSAWEGFILSLEDGDGQISVTLRNIVEFANAVLSTLTKLNRSSKEIVIDALRETSRARVANLEGQISDNKEALEKIASDEISILESRANRNIISQKEAAKQILAINEQLEDDLTGLRQTTIKERIAVLETSISGFQETSAKAAELADQILSEEEARNKRNQFRPDFVKDQLNERQKATVASVQAFRDEEEELKLLNLLLEKNVDLIQVESSLSVGSSKAKAKATREFIGLIEEQSRAVSFLAKQIRAANDEELILSLSIEQEKEKEELDRLLRIATSTREEFEKQQIKLIEDSTERRVALETLRSEKIIKKIRDNSRATTEEKEDLILKEEERLAAFTLDLEIKRDIKKIKLDADLAKAEFEQSRSGFKTEADFEEEKAAQFLAIKKNKIDAEIKLLEEAGREEDKVRIAQLKADRAKLFEFAKETEKDNSDIQKAILDKIDESLQARSDKRLEALDKELMATEEQQDRLRDLAERGVLGADESLVAEEKRAAEIERQKRDEERRQELISAGFKIFTALLEEGKSPGEAVLETSAILGALPAIIEALPTFIEGTEHVGTSLGKPQLSGQDGHIIRVDGSERIVDPSNNVKIGGRSNDEVGNLMQDYNSGLLGYMVDFNQPRTMEVSTNWQSNEQVLRKFDSLEKRMMANTRAIENKPVFDDVTFNRVMNQITVSMKSKNKTVNTTSKSSVY